MIGVYEMPIVAIQNVCSVARDENGGADQEVPHRGCLFFVEQLGYAVAGGVVAGAGGPPAGCVSRFGRRWSLPPDCGLVPGFTGWLPLVMTVFDIGYSP